MEGAGMMPHPDYYTRKAAQGLALKFASSERKF